MRLKAAQDDRYLENVLLEVKRLWPPFLGGRRLAKEVNICFFSLLNLHSSSFFFLLPFLMLFNYYIIYEFKISIPL